MTLTAAASDFFYLVCSYLLLVLASRSLWLALRGWHALSARDAPMTEVAAVVIVFGGVPACSSLIQLVDPVVVSWRQELTVASLLLGLTYAIWLVRSATGLRWRAVAIDAAGLARLGINPRAVVCGPVIFGCLCWFLATAIGGAAMLDDVPGHLALAGVAIVMLAGRPFAVMVVVAAALTLALVIESEFGRQFARIDGATLALACMLSVGRWRISNNKHLHVS